MCTTDHSEERLSIVQMNAELRHAQLELLSAHCATYKLRLRFSAEDLARHGRRDVLRKSIETASALNEYFLSVEKQIPTVENLPERGRINRRNRSNRRWSAFHPTCGISATTTCLRRRR